METISKEFKKRVRNLLNITQSYRSWQGIFFNLTYKCPLRCKYCYIDPSLEDMTVEEVDYVMTQLVKDKSNYSRTITFFGGEPCLKIDIMEHIISKYSSLTLPGENEPRFRFAVITGFSVNQDRLMELYKKHPFEIVISYDNAVNGQRIWQNGTSFSSWDEFQKFDVKDYAKYVSLQKTMNGREVNIMDDIRELQDINTKYGIIYCWGHNKTPFADFDYDKLLREYTQVVEFFVERILDDPNAYIPKIFATEWLRANNHMPTENCGGCGLMRELFISHNARIYPCSISNSQLPGFELSDEDNSEAISDAEAQYLDNPTCDVCDVRHFCNGGCLVHRYQVHEAYGTPVDAWCQYIKQIHQSYQNVIKTLTDEQIQHISNVCIPWVIGYYRACSSAVANTNILGGDYTC